MVINEIKRSDQSLADLRTARLDLVARQLERGGFVAIVSLEAGVPATQAYMTNRGRLLYVAGSKALLERYQRESRIRKTDLVQEER